MVVIAISGKPGSGSSTVARMLAKKLGIDFFSPGQKFFKSSKKVDDTSETLNLWKNKRGKTKSFHENIDNYQRELARKGNIVICGKLSIWILRDFANLKVWLDCNFEERVRRTSERDKISFEEARKKLKEREGLEEKEWERIYGFNRNNQKKIADMVIDATHLRPEEIVEKIIKSLNL